ncbi:MAG: TonB-dependent receptor plug domain-containing protein [Emticicia sp.]|uniref:TonB-dependent receptor plug domain-containing protein n=1 Tax=Emticicia sp. TaxID=1930953 RepID=UPI003BA62FD5
MKTNLLSLALATLLFAFTFEDDLLEKIVSKFNRYQDEFPQEKAYLQLDKPYYTAGETVWFKAYLVEANTLLPDTISIPLYVELIDNQRNKLIDKKILKLEGGSAAADFQLADTLKAGYYSLRAYTNWMLNFDDNLLFTKDFKVYRPSQADEPTKLNAQEIDFQFFPEGGNMVEGIENRLAYKATDALGSGLDVSGIILNDKGDTIVNFESEHLGMGVMIFKPQMGEKYTAKIRYRNIYEKEIPLPTPLKEGFVMGIESVADKDNIRLFVGHNSTAPAGQIAIVGQSQGKVCYTAKTVSTKKVLLVKIPKNKFPGGITQFTVFNEKGLPLCERLVFLKKDSTLDVKLSTNKAQYKTREKVTVEIEAKDAKGQAVSGDFSVSVTDAGQVLEKPFGENIATYLLLSSDLKGRIEQPAYYFSKENPDAARHLDILMMTQGWRRYQWNDIMKDELPKTKFLFERGLSLSGEISRPNGKAFEKPVNLTFMFKLKDSTQLFGMGMAEKDGSFAAYNLNFVDSAQVIIQAIAGNNNRNTKIFINRNFSPKVQVVAIPFNAISFDEKDLADYLKRTKEALDFERTLRFNKAIMLAEVTVKAKKKTQERDSRVLYDKASKSLTVDRTMSGYTNILDLIRGRFAGVQVSGSVNDPTITIRGVSSIMLSSEPMFLLDGMQTTKDAILMLPVPDVDRVDILTGAEASIYGTGAGGGVISILTKRGNPNYDYSQDETMGVQTFGIAGYYPTKEFYAPKYDVDIPENLRPDFRSTIFWAPKVKTDANGKASITFFNTDATTNVHVTMEGISSTGIPVAAKTTYSVSSK